MKKTYITLLLIISFYSVNFSQTISTSVGSVSSCEGNIIVPVLIQNGTGIAAISLALDYNTSVLNYQGYQNLNSSLNTGLNIINESNGSIFISFMSTNSINLPNDTLIELLFYTNGGNCNLTWDTQTNGNCEYSDIIGNSINANFSNGSISSGGTICVINSGPSNRTILEGQSTNYSISSSGVANFQWQRSTDNGYTWANLLSSSTYSGVYNYILYVNNAVIGMNGYQFRCIVHGSCPSTDTSSVALLNVNPQPQEITISAGSVTTCAGNIIIPVNITTADNLASISLKLNYNSSKLTFLNSQNINDSIQNNGFYSINESNGQIIFSWFNTTEVDFNSGILFNLNFYSNGSTTTLDWNNQIPGDCEFTDINGNIINSFYNNGQVTSAGAVASIYNNPFDRVIMEGSNTNFYVSASGVSSYNWQISSDNGLNWSNLNNSNIYSGSTNYKLFVYNVSLSMSLNQYRCIVNGYCLPADTSEMAKLIVTPQPQHITVTAGTITNSCSGNISVPIMATDCNNVAAISFKLNYNTSVLSFEDCTFPSSSLSNISPIGNQTSNGLFISWASINPISIGTDTLMILYFSSTGGTTSLTWDTQPGTGEIASLEGSIIQSTYYNGSVSVNNNPLLVDAGANDTIFVGSGITLNASTSGGSTPYSYQWQPNSSLSSSNTATPFANPVLTTNYTVEVIDANSCHSFDYVNLLVLDTILPFINTHPVSAIKCENESQLFSVIAIGNFLSYQWQFNGIDINGANGNNYQIALLSTTHSGTYSCIVSNLFGSIVSNLAQLTVNALPQVSIIGLPSNSCTNHSNYSLSGLPSGGFFTGIGIENYNEFNPSISGEGNFQIEYTFSDNNCTVTEIQNIIVNISPIVQLFGTDNMCNGDSSGTIEVILQNITSTYNIEWSNGDSTLIVNQLYAGEYFVTITDANNCNSINSVTIIEPDTIILTGTSSNVTSYGGNNGSIELYVTGGNTPYTFSWSNGVSNQNIYNLIADTFEVTVSDANSCLAITSFIIDQPNPLVINSNIQGIECFNSTNGAIELLINGGIPPYSYLWSTGDSTSSIYSLGTGTYNVTVTDFSGNSDSSSFLLMQPTAIDLSILSGNPLCNQSQDGFINISATGGTPPYTFEWSSGSTNQNLSFLIASIYAITITDANYCEFIESIELIEPLLITFNANVVDVNSFGASNGAISLNPGGGTSPYSYFWNNNATTNSIIGLTAGVYSVSIEDANACIVDSSILVTQPTDITMEGFTTNLTCNSDNSGIIELSIMGGVLPYNINWSNNETTSTIQGLSSGTYSVTVQDANNVSIINTYNITEPTIISTSAVIVSVSTAGSADGSINLYTTGGISPYSYNWSNNLTSEDITMLPIGIFDLTITDANNCTLIESFIIEQAIDLQLCSNDANHLLDFGSPIGGIYVGNSVSQSGSDYFFDPTTATSGLSTILYIHNNDTSQFVIEVVNADSPGNFSLLQPVNPTYGITYPILFSWNPSLNSTYYDLYIWREGEIKPTTPTVGNIIQTNYSFTQYLDQNYIYNWLVEAHNLCSDISSNIYQFSFQLYPDLTPTSLSIPTLVQGGTTFPMSFTIENIGVNGTGWSNWSDLVYISTDTIFDVNSDLLIGGFPKVSALGLNSNYQNSVNVLAPQNEDGIYYVFIVANGNQELVESDYSNNILRSISTINILSDPLPDLTVENVSILNLIIIPDSVISVSWVVNNIGDTTAIGGWSQKVSLVNNTERILLGYFQNSNTISSSGSISQIAEFIVPQFIDFEDSAFIEVQLIPNFVETVDGGLNNIAISSQAYEIENKLFFSIGEMTLIENSQAQVNIIVYRTGSMNNDLTVELSIPIVSIISMPDSVIIPAGQSGVSFDISAIDNNFINTYESTNITATGNNYSQSIIYVTIIDNEFPALLLTSSQNTANEGDSIELFITSEIALNNSLFVNISSSQSNQIVLPSNIVIPAGQTTYSFYTDIIDDVIPEFDEDLVITISASGFISGTDTLTVFDDDFPFVSLSIIPDTVSEGNGGYAAWGRIELLEASQTNITLNLSANPAGEVFLPSQVIIPAGVTEKMFSIGVIDNLILDGQRTITISAAVLLSSCNCSSSSQSGGSISSELYITDNDVTGLSIEAEPYVAAEGVVNAGVLKISLNTTLNSALTIAIQLSDSTEISVTNSVILPANQNYIEVPYNTLDDGLEDGDQFMSITISADTLSPASCWIMVTDQNMPDLVISNFTTSSDSIILHDTLNITLNISNQGYASVSSGATVDFFISSNTVFDSSDEILLSTQTTTSLNIGDSIAISENIIVNTIIGDYYIFARVNNTMSITELLYINNQSELAALHIQPDYNAIAIVDSTVFDGNSAINIYGTVENLLNQPLANKAIDIYIVVDGVRRTINTTSENTGQFSVNFMPMNGEAGEFYVGACFPGQGLDEVQDEFVILGMKYTGSTLIWETTLSQTETGTIQVKNFSNITLNNLNIEIISAPAECTLSFNPIISLQGYQTVAVNYTLNSTGVSIGNYFAEIELRIYSSEGADYNFSAWFYCMAAEGYIVANPGSIVTTMVQNQSNIVEFEIRNIGQGETDFVEISLPQTEWLSLVSLDTITTISPGGSSIVTLRLRPGNSLPLNVPITGSIAINCGNANNLLVPFSIEPISTETGTLVVDVVDEYTYNTALAPHLEGARVRVYHPYTGVLLADTTTNSLGIAQIDSLPEGYYTLRVDAENHSTQQRSIYIEKGITNNETVFISFQAITYSWEVVPTQIEDTYTFELVVEYETNVPAPVVIMSLPDSLPELDYGENHPFLLTMKNEGLITAEDVDISFADVADYEFTFLVEEFDLLPQQVIEVPVVMTRILSQKSGDANNYTCFKAEATTLYYYSCGLNRQWNLDRVETTIGSDVCIIDPGEFDFGTVSPSPFNPGPNTITPMGPSGTNTDDNALNSWINNLSNPPSITQTEEGCTPCAQALTSSVVGCVPGVGCELSYLTNTAFEASYSENLEDFGIAHNEEVTGYVICKTKEVAVDAIVEIIPVVGPVVSIGSCLYSILTSYMECTHISTTELDLSINSSPNNIFKSENYASLKNSGLDSSYISIASNLYNIVYHEAANLGIFQSTFKEEEWLSEQSIEYFFDLFSLNLDTTNLIDSIGVEYIKSNFTGSVINDSLIQVFAERWNRSTNYHSLGIENLSQVPYGWNTDFIEIDSLSKYYTILDSTYSYAINKGFMSIDDMIEFTYDKIEEFAQQENASVCASISLSISQTLTLTREAFEGTLTIFNGHDSIAIQDVSLNLQIKNDNGDLCNNLFQIETLSLNELTQIDGSGNLYPQQTGSAMILFIPEPGAAPTIPISYKIGGTLSYLDPFTNTVVTKPLFPVTIQVSPSPDLHIDYFLQRNILGDDALTEQVEPVIPADFAVMVHNQGMGQAKNVMIESAEPQIIENEKGLLVDFNIIGSNFGSEEINLGLKNINFGNIEAGNLGVGHWWVTSSLMGHFISYDVSVNHSDSYGNQDLSLVSSVEVHELIHSITDYGALNDSIYDFLVNDIPDINDYPDIIYFTNGTTADVSYADSAYFDGPLTLLDTILNLSMQPSLIGWNYIQMDDPGNGMYRIVSVTRDDGQVIPLDNIWLTHVTIPDFTSPVYENKLHFTDKFSQNQVSVYTIVFEPLDKSTPEVFAINGVPSGVITSPVTELEIIFTEPIDSTSFSFEDLSLTLDAGINLIDSLLSFSNINDSTINIDLYGLTFNNGLYIFEVDPTGITDRQGNTGIDTEQISWTQSVSAPIITMFLGLDSFNTSSIDTLHVLFNVPIDSTTFTHQEVYLINPLSDSISIQTADLLQLDLNGLHFSISGLAPLNTIEGNYSLVFALPDIEGLNGQTGINNQSVSWSVCPSPLPEVIISNDTILCESQIIQLISSVSNTISLEWTTSGSGIFSNSQINDPIYNASLEDLTKDVTLTLTALGNSACALQVYDSLILGFANPPSVIVNGNTSICANEDFQLFGIVENSISYSWSTTGDGSFNSPYSLTPIYTPGTNDKNIGVVDLTLTAQPIEGCSDIISSSMSLTIFGEPLSNAGANQILCVNQQVELIGNTNNSNSYVWSSPGDGIWLNQNTLNPSYIPGVTDKSNGAVELTLLAHPNTQCLNASVSSTIISFQQLPIARPGEDLIICEGELCQLNGVFENADYIQWLVNGDGSLNNPTIYNPVYYPGPADISNGYAIISVVATSNNYCIESDSASILINYQSPPFIFIGDDIISNTASLEILDAGEDYSTYLWSTGELTQQIVIDGSLLGAGEYIFNVSVTDIFECQNSDTINVTMIDTITSQTILLPVGWSLFSTYIDPTILSIDIVLSPIVSNLVIAKDNNGQAYWPFFGINQIGNISNGNGYQLKLTNIDTLVIEGYILRPDLTPIEIPNGWSLLGYLRTNPAPIVEMLSSIVSNLIIVKNDQGMSYWPFFGLDFIGDMLPGKAYQVKLSTSDSLLFPSNANSYNKTDIYQPKLQHFNPGVNSGNNMTIGIPVSSWNIQPDIGDEIGIFSSKGMIVGAGVFYKKNMAICIWGDDEITESIEGLLYDEEYTLKLWSNTDNIEPKIFITNWTKGDEKFNTNKISIVSKLSFNYKHNFILHPNKPNPFVNETEFSFYISEKINVELSILGIKGEVLEVLLSKELESGEHVINYQTRRLPAGTYFYRLEAGDYSETKKMVIVR